MVEGRIEVSEARKGELKDCPICRFIKGRSGCDLPNNRIEKVEEVNGRCVYFSKTKYNVGAAVAAEVGHLI